VLEALRLDEDRLVHIGFNKTGTTYVQGALKLARPRLLELGVVYPGRERQHKTAAVALTGARGRLGDKPATMKDWDRLVRRTAAAGDKRVLVSSEWLCQAKEDEVRKAVNDLGGPRVHVVATLRPLGKILPSSWQQYVQNGLRSDYGTWLDGMLRRAPYQKPTPSFWARHRHDVVLSRWASVVGPDHVTAIIVDPRDHGLLLRQFESMLALPEGVLVPEPPELDNRSLSAPEAEMLRLVNVRFHEEQWPGTLYREAIRNGLVAHLVHTRPASVDVDPIVTPEWALERAAEIGKGIVENIRASGINVVGDLESLGQVQPAKAASADDSLRVPPALAAEALIGAIRGGRRFGARHPVASQPLQAAFSDLPSRSRVKSRLTGWLRP
jgi:hypothetical protein